MDQKLLPLGVVIAMPPKANIAVAGRATSVLAHCIMAHLRLAVRQEQQERNCQRVHLPLFAMGAWGIWQAILTFQLLRLETGFPVFSHVMRSLQEQTAQLIGITCLGEALAPYLGLSVQDRADAAAQRELVQQELDDMPTWMESRLQLLTVENRVVLERYMTAFTEIHFELQDHIPDPLIKAIADRFAETCIRCRFRQAPDTVATPVPSASHGISSGATAYGFGPPRDPNLALTAAAVATGPDPTPVAAPSAAPGIGAHGGPAGYESSEEWSWDS